MKRGPWWKKQRRSSSKPTFEYEGWVRGQRFETTAHSEAQARRYIAFQARKAFNLKPDTFLEINSLRKILNQTVY